MATVNGTPGLATGPCQNMIQAFFGGLDAAALSWDPVVKSAARANLEAINFWNRRAQSYLEIPSRLASCRTPQDVVGEQLRFWQNAARDYQDCARKVMGIWAQAVPNLPFGEESSRRKPARDVITLPNDGESAERDASRRAA